MRAGLPGSVPMPYGWTTALARAGLTDVTSRSTVLEWPVPLTAADLHAVVRSLAHRVDRLRATRLLEPADLRTWDRLLDPAGPAPLAARDDPSPRGPVRSTSAPALPHPAGNSTGANGVLRMWTVVVSGR